MKQRVLIVCPYCGKNRDKYPGQPYITKIYRSCSNCYKEAYTTIIAKIREKAGRK